MLKGLRNKKAQAVMAEYALTIFLVVAVVISMTIYFRRAVQARIHDSRDYMISEVRTRTGAYFTGNLYKEYEPYYVNSASVVSRDTDTTVRLLPGGSSGIFQKDIDERTAVQTTSETAPPREFDLTTPKN